MKRNEFKLLVENWRQNLVLEMDADMMSSDMMTDEIDDKAALDSAIQNLVSVINQGMYQADDKQYALDQIQKLTQGVDAFGLGRSEMSMDESLIESDEEMAVKEMESEVNKEIDEDDECGY